jgi:hypothetical protein
MGEPRTAYGLATREGDVLTRVDVHQVVSGHVERTNSLVRQSNSDVEVTNAAGHVIQMFPLGNVVPGTGTAGAEAGVSDCSICQVVVDILYGVVACGGVAQYFICLFVCAGFTVGVGVPICAIACGVLVGLCCYLSGNLLKELACKTWCG